MIISILLKKSWGFRGFHRLHMINQLVRQALTPCQVAPSTSVPLALLYPTACPRGCRRSSQGKEHQQKFPKTIMRKHMK